MARKTISFPTQLERRIQRLADERGLSFSAAVVALLDEGAGDEPLPYEARGSGPGDLSTNADLYLERIAAERAR